MIIASVRVHCILLSGVEAAIVRRPAHPAAASRVLLLGRVGLRAPREDGIDQVADEGDLEMMLLRRTMHHIISVFKTKSLLEIEMEHNKKMMHIEIIFSHRHYLST